MHGTEILANTVADACDILSIKKSYLYRLVAERKIAARALGGRTIILAESLRSFINALPPAPIGRRDAA